MIGFLAVLSLCMLVFVCLSLPKILKLPFYPSFSAFTFPFVITAIAMKGTYAYLTTIQINIPFMGYFVHLLEIWAVLIVCFVFFKYTLFMVSDRSVTHATSQTDRNYNAP
jgi:exfoliative toxin A/B